MIAIDTNIVVRLLTNDEPEQARRAAALFQRESEVWIAMTVLLEAEWVLRSAYGLSQDVINSALRKLASLPSVQLENPNAIAHCLDMHALGMDFADALHLSLSDKARQFATFDRKLRRLAGRKAFQNIPEVVEP